MGDPTAVALECQPAWVVGSFAVAVGGAPLPASPSWGPKAMCCWGRIAYSWLQEAQATQVKVQRPSLSFLLWGNISNQQAQLWQSPDSFRNSQSCEGGNCFVQGLLLGDIQTLTKLNFCTSKWWRRSSLFWILCPSSHISIFPTDLFLQDLC